MQFLSDVFIRCPDCDGRRYRPHILEIRISPEPANNDHTKAAKRKPVHSLSIGDVLEATVEEAIEFLAGFAESRPAQRAIKALTWLREVGLGYLKLGQPINTLSGGESQRLKLVKHLAEATVAGAPNPLSSGPKSETQEIQPDGSPTLFLFDEPTTGLHFEDVRVLLRVFQSLIDAGHSLVVVEHNLDVIQAADWVIDLGPDAGDQGGHVVAVGTPEEIAACQESHTGRALRNMGTGVDDSSERSGRNHGQAAKQANRTLRVRS
jgi:excinuclease ABC subunit A